MTTPDLSASPIKPPPDNAPVVLRILLAIVLSLPGLAGLAVIGIATGLWLSGGFAFSSGDRDFIPFFVLPAAALMMFSVISIGIILRFARWRNAPVASLVLAVLSAVVIVISDQLVLDAMGDDDDTHLILLVCALLALLATSVPPLMHWWSADLRPGKPAN